MAGLYQSIMDKSIYVVIGDPRFGDPDPPSDVMEQIVNEDLLAFQTWFCENVDTSAGKLSGIEIAILKSYLWYKLHPGEKPHGNPSSR